jgi:hypothetical protein
LAESGLDQRTQIVSEEELDHYTEFSFHLPEVAFSRRAGAEGENNTIQIAINQSRLLRRIRPI